MQIDQPQNHKSLNFKNSFVQKMPLNEDVLHMNYEFMRNASLEMRRGREEKTRK